MQFPITPKAFYLSALEQIIRAGLTPYLSSEMRGVEIPENLIPKLPNSQINVFFPGQRQKHDCFAEIESPELLFLVVPLTGIIDAHDMGHRYTYYAESFLPYWAIGKLIHFEWQARQLKDTGHRKATGIEVICAMAQYGYYGAFLSHGSSGKPFEACYGWFGSGKVGLHDNPRRGEYHHQLMIVGGDEGTDKMQLKQDFKPK